MAALPSWPGRGVSAKWPGPFFRSLTPTPSTTVLVRSMDGMRRMATGSPCANTVGGATGMVLLVVDTSIVVSEGLAVVEGALLEVEVLCNCCWNFDVRSSCARAV